MLDIFLTSRSHVIVIPTLICNLLHSMYLDRLQQNLQKKRSKNDNFHKPLRKPQTVYSFPIHAVCSLQHSIFGTEHSYLSHFRDVEFNFLSNKYLFDVFWKSIPECVVVFMSFHKKFIFLQYHKKYAELFKPLHNNESFREFL